MKIGVTGGSGFIGSWVVDELINLGYDPVVFDHLGRVPSNNSEVEVFLGDVRDQTAMTELAAHVDGIIHLAAVLGTQETIKNPRPAAESNLLGGLNFLEAVAQYEIPGTYICVGNHWMNNTYSISKTMIEKFARMFNKERGTKVNLVRCVNAYGPRQSVAAPYGSSKVRKITPSFICRALNGDPIEVYGSGNQISDMVYVEDVARALVGALFAPLSNDVIEVGPSISNTVNEVANLVADLVSDRGYKKVPVNHLPMRPGENPDDKVTADNSTCLNIGINPKTFTGLVDGLNNTITWYESQKNISWFGD